MPQSRGSVLSRSSKRAASAARLLGVATLLAGCAHYGPWAPSTLVVRPCKLVATRSGRVGFELHDDGAVVVDGKPLFRVERTRILDARGAVVAELGANGLVTFAGVTRPARIAGGFRTVHDVALPMLRFASTDISILPWGQPIAYDTSVTPAGQRPLLARFEPYDEEGAIVDEILLALTLVGRGELDREPSFLDAP